MNTDELATLLAKGAGPIDPRGEKRRVATGLVLGVLGACTLCIVSLGLRPNLIAETALPMFWAREAFCAAVGIAAFWAALRLGHPGRRLGKVPLAIGAPVVVMWGLAALALADDPSERTRLIFGSTAAVCPPLIALVSTPLFAALIWIAKGLAPTQLRIAGAMSGLAAGAFGALAYTLHCPELAAPFLGIWYVLGMLIPAAAGAWLGPRLLRW